MFNFDPVILRQTTSEIDVCWKNVDNCDVYKIEHNTTGLEGKIVYWGKDTKCQISHLHDNFCYKFKFYALKFLDGEYTILFVSDIFKASTLPNIPTTISFYRAVRKAQDYLVRRYILSSPHLIDIPGPNLQTPLGNVVLNGFKDIVEIIINAKADVNLGCPRIKRTPLHISMFHGHVTIGKLLIDHKADKRLKDIIGLNFVHYAVNGGHFNAIRFALDNADDEVLLEQNQFGWNILILAIFMRCHVKIIKLLMGYDDRIKTSNEQKREALHLADITNQDDTLAYLRSVFSNSADELLGAGRALCMEAPQEGRKVFSTIKGADAQNKENYFIESADKIRYFFEDGALGDKGELLVEPTKALNKVGHALHTEHPIFKKVTFSDRVKEVCWQLGFRKPVVPQSMYIYKNPGIGGEVKSHQDASYLHTEPNSTIGFWIPLEDATLENGCLKFIKGSHNSGVHRRYIRNPDKQSTELLVYDSPAPIYPLSSFANVPVSKGSLVIIHGQAVHRSELNKSKKSRHAYTFHVIESDGVTYSENNWLQPPAGKQFPLLYSKTD